MEKIIHCDDFTKENIKNSPNWLEIPDHLYRLLIVGISGSKKQIYCLIW